MSRGRAQTAFEFIMMASLVLIMGAIFLSSVAGALHSATDDQLLAMINDVGYTVQDELILALSVEDGYTRTFDLPEHLGKREYEIANSGTVLTITSGPYTVTYDIPEVAGAFTKGQNTIRKSGSVTII